MLHLSIRYLVVTSAPSRCYADYLSVSTNRCLISCWYLLFDGCTYWRKLSKGKDGFDFFFPAGESDFSPAAVRLLSNFVLKPKAVTFCRRKFMACRGKVVLLTNQFLFRFL